jgi:hypothetical protein
MTEEEKVELLKRLYQQLESLDEETLRHFEATMASEDAARALSRREFLLGTAAGGAVGLAVAAGGGWLAWQAGETKGRVAAEISSAADLAKASAEIAALKGLVALYETLEGIGIDAIATAGIGAIGLALEGVEAGALTVKRGLDTVEQVLDDFEAGFPAIRAGIEWTEGIVSRLADALQRLEDAVGEALEKASPITEALGSFVKFILDHLPGDAGEKARETLGRIEEIVTAVPEAVEGINSHLLEPLRRDWFSDDPNKGLKATLIDPIIKNLFDPLETHLADFAALLDRWEKELAVPLGTAIERRDKVRQQIAQYKKEHGFM